MRICCRRLLSRSFGCARAFAGGVGLVLAVAWVSAARGEDPPQIPELRWEERSDWTNIRTDVLPVAVGDGKADDTKAIQAALDAVRDGAVLYFPAGEYRITATLRLRKSKGDRWTGGLIVGAGRDTRWVWDGGEGGTMVALDGVAYSRFVGLTLDGRARAGVGFHYQATQGFQTEVTHRHLAFRGFRDSAILEDHPGGGQALAETTFENCLFEDCGRGVAFLQFNDYDYTFDGCEFRRCGVGVDCAHGNFYVRNCHFVGSSIVDIRDLSEHGSSVRRTTSLGSRAFVIRGTSVAPLTLQDCQVEGWTDPGGAVQLSRPPVLMFDCVFSRAPLDGQGRPLAPVRTESAGQRLWVSGNEVRGGAGLIQGPSPSLMAIPRGARAGAVHSAGQTFLRSERRGAGRVFDARRDFGAKGDGVADDTGPVQAAIDAAAAASGGAVAYLPTGRYAITSTLRVRGRDFSVEGSGWHSRLIWRGAAGGVMMEVRDPRDVVVADLMVGAHDAGTMDNGVDIQQIGSAAPSRMTYDGVYVFGMYQKAPLRRGLRFARLTEHDVVRLPHVQGNLRFDDCARATVVANCSYEGSVTVEGKAGVRDGLLGFQTRLATIVSHGLYLRDSQCIVMSDFYLEQADNGFSFEGSPGDPPGRATLSGAKFQSFASTDPGKNSLMDIRGYRGQILCGPYQLYMEPKRMRMRQTGDGPVDILLWGSSWYGAVPELQLGGAARAVMVGNEAYGDVKGGEAAGGSGLKDTDPTDDVLATLGRGLDDLRRLGEADLRLNHAVPLGRP